MTTTDTTPATISVGVELDADTVAALGICQHFAGDPPGARAEAAAMIERTLVNECVRRAERLGLDPARWQRSPVLVDYPAGEPDAPNLRVRIRAGAGAEEVEGPDLLASVATRDLLAELRERLGHYDVTVPGDLAAMVDYLTGPDGLHPTELDGARYCQEVE